MFSNQDLNQIAQRGNTPEAIKHQLTEIKEGFPFLKIEAAAAVGNGILSLDSEQVEKFVNEWATYLSDQHTIVKFVPASGAASRMFKNLFSFLSADYDEPTTDFEKYFLTTSRSLLSRRLFVLNVRRTKASVFVILLSTASIRLL